MDTNVVEKCLAFCQALVSTNKTFSFNLSISKDSFNFTNKELQTSSCRVKKKSPSQIRREERRKNEREHKKSKVTVEVADGSFSEVSKDIFQCTKCEENFKTEKGLNIHIGRMHKENVIESTPEKERCSAQNDLSLNLTPTKDVSREILKPDDGRLVCTECGNFWGPPTTTCSTAYSVEKQVKWNNLCSKCWTNYSPNCPDYYRFCN